MAATFYSILAAAVADMAEHGYSSQERLDYWMAQLAQAAAASLTPEYQMEQMLRDAMAATYRRLVDNGQVLRYHQGISRFTLDKVRPQLRAELDRRIMAAAQLIRLNRRQAIEKTLQRFSGWSTSVPIGGTPANRVEVAGGIRKSLAGLKFEERRVLIDQSHKLTASINEILARDGQAIAGTWHSHWRQAGYNYRQDHKERDEQVYMLKDNWARERGLAKPGPAGYYEDITSVGEEPFCRCYMIWHYSLGNIPSDMLTKKGEAALAQARTAA